MKPIDRHVLYGLWITAGYSAEVSQEWKEWARSRFVSPYLRNTLWDMGYALDTLESAVPWSMFEQARVNTLAGIRSTLEAEGVGGHAFSHLSHLYTDGAGFYITYIFPRSEDPEGTLSTWRAVKRSACESILAGGGTISHQHGVGLDHRDALPGEKSRAGMQLIRAVAQAVDPAGVLNPGKLIAVDPPEPSL